MFLVELVMQGVRGIRELSRLRFQGGFNFIAAGNESGKTSSADTIVRLLFPISDPAVTAGLLSKYTPDASRAALVAFSDDGAYYRVIEDFSKCAVNLSKYNPETKDFSLLYKDWDNTIQFMGSLTAGITEEEFTKLFILRRDHYNGLRGRSVNRAITASVRPVVTKPAQRNSTAPLEARIAERREALRKAEEAADADYRAHAAKLKLEELRKKLDSLEEIQARREDLQSQFAALKGCETLPENLNDLIKEHEMRQGQKMAETDKLTQEIEGLQNQLDEMPVYSLLSDKLFLVGALAGAASLAIGLFLPTLIPAEYFPIGILFSLFLIAIAWYNGSRKNAQRKLIVNEVKILEADLSGTEKSFEQGGAAILECMKATGSSTTSELEDKAGNYRYFLSLQEDLTGQRERILGDATREELQTRYEQMQQEVMDLEKNAAALANDAVDAYSLRQDIERLETELAVATGAPERGAGPELSEDVMVIAPPAAAHAGILAELATASRIGGIEMDTLIAAVEAAAQRNLAAITGGRYVRVEAGHEGSPVVHAKDDSVVHFEDLSHGTRDVIYFCLRTGLIEALAGKRRLPFILDDPLAGFDPVRQQAACQVLRALGAKTQVVLYTSNPALKAAGDAGGELK